MFRVVISPIFRSTRLYLQLVVEFTDDVAGRYPGCGRTPHPGYRLVTSWVHYTTSCKHSLVLLKMGEIIARNMLS